jgi:cation transport protein ChaC
VDVWKHEGDATPEVKNALIYMANPLNPHYLGPAAEEVISKQIFHSVGPSGTNLEYLLNLGAHHSLIRS